MKVYGTPQAGGGPTGLGPGDAMTLFDGTEVAAAGLKSLAFARTEGPGGQNPPLQFSIDFAAAPTAAVLIQGANVDAEANYQTLKTSTNTQHDNYIDTGTWAFYRAVLNTYVAGGTPVVTVQR